MCNPRTDSDGGCLIDTIDVSADLCSYVLLTPVHAVVVDRHGVPWSVWADASGDVYGRQLTGSWCQPRPRRLTPETLFETLAPAQVIYLQL